MKIVISIIIMLLSLFLLFKGSVKNKYNLTLIGCIFFIIGIFLILYS